MKTAICGLGANVAPNSIERAGKCIGEIVSLCHRFDSMCGIHPESSAHSSASVEKDLKMIVNELISKSKVFMYTAGRTHSSMKVKRSIFSLVDKQNLLTWMKKRLEFIIP